MKRPRAAALVLAVLSSSLVATASPRPCAAQEPPSREAAKEAEVHFRRAVDLYKQGDAAGAIVEFHRAYELAPNYRVLYNIGQTYYQLQRYADAMKALRSYLSGGGTAIPAAKRAQVEADIRMLESHVADVEVRVSQAGAQIAVDDEVVGTSPLRAPVLVSIGHRKVSALKGAQRVDRFVDIATGDHASVVLELPVESAPPVPVIVPPTPPAPSTTPAVVRVQPPPAPPPPEPASNSTVKWVLWGTTGALAVGTAVTGILTLTAQSNLSAQLNTFPGSSTQIDQTRSQGRSLGLVTDGLMVATAVAGGLALWVTLSNHSSSPKVGVLVGPGALQLEGRFQ